MLTCWIRRIVRRSERQLFLPMLLLGVVSLGSVARAQIYIPPAPPEHPSDYGKVVLDSKPSPGKQAAVVFDHWLHRSRFTCRLCHVDVGFGMQANSTGITDNSNRHGFHCGACHDGKRLFNGKPIFAACGDDVSDPRCARCHSVGKEGARKYEYKEYTAKLPKGVYGVDWEVAESEHLIRPVDFLDGLGIQRPPLQSREDFKVKPQYSWVKPITFSHKKHSVWNGCEVCHPDIFPTTKKGSVRYSMFLNVDGRYCGACHTKVAFPLNHCQGCHPDAPPWVVPQGAKTSALQ